MFMRTLLWMSGDSSQQAPPGHLPYRDMKFAKACTKDRPGFPFQTSSRATLTAREGSCVWLSSLESSPRVSGAGTGSQAPVQGMEGWGLSWVGPGGPPRGCWAALPARVSPHQRVKGIGSLRNAICSMAAGGWQGPALEGSATVACCVPCVSARCHPDPQQGCHSS